MYKQAHRVKTDPQRQTAEQRERPTSTVESTQAQQVVRSSYLVERLFQTPEHNLFNYVKFKLVNQHIENTGVAQPWVMDIGCGLQVAKRFLNTFNPNIAYYGIDYEPTFKPDAVVDLNVDGTLEKPMQLKPDVVMLLDVLEHLHDNTEDLDQVIQRVAQSMPQSATLIITVPQWYRLDRFKLKHLHYPEHKIRLTQSEWRNAIEKHFDIRSTQGVGYLSVLPYLPMASRRYTSDNRLGRLFKHLRSVTFERAWIKPIDLFLSNTLGLVKPFKFLSNDILFVAKPRKQNHQNES